MDYQTIHLLKVILKIKGMHFVVVVKQAFVGGYWTGFRALRDLDNIIWVGDLNYRINGACQDVIKLIRESKLNILLKADQLSIEKTAGNVFQVLIHVEFNFTEWI